MTSVCRKKEKNNGKMTSYKHSKIYKCDTACLCSTQKYWELSMAAYIFIYQYARHCMWKMFQT